MSEEGRRSQCGVSSSDGLAIAGDDAIRSFLQSAAESPHLTPELQDLASHLLSLSSVPYRSLRSIWSASPSTARPPLLRLFAGSHFVFSSPEPREKSEELKARLRKLADMAERKAYKDLVKDIVPKEDKTEPFSSYKDQLGFGLHVVLIMFTGYLVGFTAFRALFNHSPVMNTAGGIFGLVCGMLLETVLFIIKTSNQDIRSSSTISELKKHQ